MHGIRLWIENINRRKSFLSFSKPWMSQWDIHPRGKTLDELWLCSEFNSNLVMREYKVCIKYSSVLSLPSCSFFWQQSPEKPSLQKHVPLECKLPPLRQLCSGQLRVFRNVVEQVPPHCSVIILWRELVWIPETPYGKDLSRNSTQTRNLADSSLIGYHSTALSPPYWGILILHKVEQLLAILFVFLIRLANID